MIDVRKLNKPPAVENWSRMQYPDVARTAKRLFSFIKGGPNWNYNICRSCARYYIEDGIDRQVAERIVSSKGSELGRKYNAEAVAAFFDLVEESPIEGVRAFDQMVEWFPLGPGVVVPIRPLAVVRLEGQFAPIFLNPWSEIAFDEYQASLYMTVLEKSIFRLTDFENSDGQIIFLPKYDDPLKKKKRKPVVWRRGQYPTLTDVDLNEQIKVFTEGKAIAARLAEEYNANLQ